MIHNWKTRTALVGLALVPVVAWSALAPAPFATGPTPISSLPFTINDPGTYCLTGNLTAGAGVAGIDVQSSDVVIDLGGFRLSGGGDSPGTGVRSTRRNVTVRNGAISGWGEYGIELGDEATVSDVQVRTEGSGCIRVDSRSLVERTTTRSTSGFGILLQGFEGTVDNCRVVITETTGELGSGVTLLSGGTIRGTKVFGGRIGISGVNQTRVLGCYVTSYTALGIGVSSNCVIKDTNVDGFPTEPSSTGISALGSAVIEDCTVGGIAETGIFAGQFSQVRRCYVRGTQASGIQVTVGSRVVDCVVNDTNTSGLPDEAGILALRQSRVEGCMVRDSGGPGILFEQPSGRVERCDVWGSNGAGILVQGDMHLIGNRVSDSTGTGIHVLADRCVLMENVSDSNGGYGIAVEGTTSHLERNLASFNKGGDFDLPYGNPHGRIERPFGQMNTLDPHTNFKTPLGF